MEGMTWPDLGPRPASWPERETPEQKLERDPVPPGDLGIVRETRGPIRRPLPAGEQSGATSLLR